MSVYCFYILVSDSVHSRLKPHALFDDALEFVDGDADLLHGVAVAQGDGVVFQGLEVDGDGQLAGAYHFLSIHGATPGHLGI